MSVCAVAAIIAAGSARPYAGSWNDGSRLATVESLVDRHTWAIDDSVFVRVPPLDTGRPAPYPPGDRLLTTYGTQDKLFIDGHFYSDKSPVPAALMAAGYAAWSAATGASARQEADRFAYWMTLGSSGIAYVVAVWCVLQIGQTLRLPTPTCLGLAASFGLSTVALAYTRHVNSHIQLLAVAAAVALALLRARVQASSGRLLVLGALAGLGYGLDLGAGPLLLVCTLGVVAWRGRRIRSVALFLLGALPWVALYHALNYAIGGTWLPANAVPAYLHWPGSPFDREHMTGVWHHSAGSGAVYAAALLVGKRGFLWHNLPVLLAVPGAIMLLGRIRQAQRPEVLWAVAWCVSTWLLYALASSNYSGVCVSVRWFVPLLAPAFLVLALVLRERPTSATDLLVLSVWGALLSALMWRDGPWTPHMVPGYWPIVAAALLSWCAYRQWRRRGRAAAAKISVPPAHLPLPWH